MHLLLEKLRRAPCRNPKYLQRGCFPCVGWVKYHWFLEISLGLIFGSDKCKAATKTQSRLVPLRATRAECRESGGRELQTLLQLLARTWLCKLTSPCCIWNTFIISLSWWFLKGTQFGSMAWSGGVCASVRGSALHGGMLHLLCWPWDFFKSHVLSPCPACHQHREVS